MSTNAKTRYNISKVFGPAVPDKGSKDSDPSADNMAGIAIRKNCLLRKKKPDKFKYFCN